MKNSLLQNGLFSFWQNRELIFEMTKRELKSLNKGSALGTLWIVISPFFQTLTYVFIVTVVFSRRIGSDINQLDYTIFVLSGMIPWQIFSRVAQTSPTIIRDRMEMVKQVIYPIETLPITNLVTNSIGALIALLVLLFMMIVTSSLNATFVLFPLALFILMTFLVGLSWVFSCIGIIFRDLREIMGLVLGVLIYVSPVVISKELVGEEVWKYVLLNPISHFIIVFRDTLYGEFHLQSWSISIALATVFYFLGLLLISHSKEVIREFI